MCVCVCIVQYSIVAVVVVALTWLQEPGAVSRDKRGGGEGPGAAPRLLFLLPASVPLDDRRASSHVVHGKETTEFNTRQNDAVIGCCLRNVERNLQQI